MLPFVTEQVLRRKRKMAPSHGYNLRRRKPRRTDPLLTEIYDALPEDLLRSIACLAINERRHRYCTRHSHAVFF